MMSIKKNISKLIAIASMVLLTSCGANWVLTTHGYDTYQSVAYNQSLRTTTSVNVYSTPTYSFTGLNPWDFSLYGNTWVQCRRHGSHNLWHFDPTYNPIFCRPSQSFLWNNQWRPFMGNVYWNYWGTSYWTDPWYNPWWGRTQIDTRPRVYINGRRGSSNATRTTNRTYVRPSNTTIRTNPRDTEFISRRSINTNPTRTNINRGRGNSTNVRLPRVEQNTRTNYNTNRSTNVRSVNSRSNGTPQIKKRNQE